MKKVISIVLSAVMVFAFTGCFAKNRTKSPQEPAYSLSELNFVSELNTQKGFSYVGAVPDGASLNLVYTDKKGIKAVKYSLKDKKITAEKYQLFDASDYALKMCDSVFCIVNFMKNKYCAFDIKSLNATVYSIPDDAQNMNICISGDGKTLYYTDLENCSKIYSYSEGKKELIYSQSGAYFALTQIVEDKYLSAECSMGGLFYNYLFNVSTKKISVTNENTYFADENSILTLDKTEKEAQLQLNGETSKRVFALKNGEFATNSMSKSSKLLFTVLQDDDSNISGFNIYNALNGNVLYNNTTLNEKIKSFIVQSCSVGEKYAIANGYYSTDDSENSAINDTVIWYFENATKKSSSPSAQVSTFCKNEIGIYNSSDTGNDKFIQNGVISALENYSGIDIVTGKDAVSDYSGYKVKAETDSEKIISALKKANKVLKYFPKGFFNKIKESLSDGIKLALVNSITATDGSIDAAAFACSVGQAHYVVLNTQSQTFEDDLLHELSHAIDARVLAQFGNFDEVWGELNPSGFAYAETYTDADGNTYGSQVDGALDNTYEKISFGASMTANDIYFIDAYSKTFPTEDRARVLEYFGKVYSGEEKDPEYLHSDKMLAKLKVYDEYIKKSFGVKNSSEFFWYKFIK